MIKVGFITSPLSSAHSVRGVGFYTKRLLAAMKDIGPKMNIEIIEILHPTSYVSLTLSTIHILICFGILYQFSKKLKP